MVALDFTWGCAMRTAVPVLNKARRKRKTAVRFASIGYPRTEGKICLFEVFVKTKLTIGYAKMQGAAAYLGLAGKGTGIMVPRTWGRSRAKALGSEPSSLPPGALFFLVGGFLVGARF